jgi:hypothetical protein
MAWLKVDEHSPYNFKVIDGEFRLAGTGMAWRRKRRK